MDRGVLCHRWEQRPKKASPMDRMGTNKVKEASRVTLDGRRGKKLGWC